MQQRRKREMLPGVKIKPLIRHYDERGSFVEVLRKDWPSILKKKGVAQANLSVTRPGIIRAWHKHNRGQTDFLICLKGSMKIGIYEDETGDLNEIFSTGERLQIVTVPGRYYHGFKSLGPRSTWLLYFTTKLYDPKDPDEERLPWNSEEITPISINGNPYDPRSRKPWDWNRPPHR
jgi:dTDP-4-dehydrorhamnose 3,5-epimerase